MRLVVAFDFAEGDVNEVTENLDVILENHSSRTFVQRVYNPDEYAFSERMLLNEIPEDALIGAIIDRLLIIGVENTSSPTSYPNKLSRVLDVSIFSDRLSEIIFEDQQG
jgi:hypothetical protein